MTAEQARPTTERLRDRAIRIADRIKPEPGMGGPHGGYVSGRDRQEAFLVIEELLIALAAAPVDRDGLRECIEALPKFEMADWPGQAFLLYEDVAALSAPEPKDRP